MLGFDATTLALIAAATLLAFVVRGLSGFGSSMIGIGALTLALPPVQVVPAFLAIELLTSVNLLPSVWRQIDWRSLKWVIAGCALATPIGLTLLARLDPNPMRLIVSATLAAIALAMLTGAAQRLTPKTMPGPWGALAVGAAAGMFNGAAGIGGPPAIVFYFATTGAAVGRATPDRVLPLHRRLRARLGGWRGLAGGRRMGADRRRAAVLAAGHLARPALVRPARRGATAARGLAAAGGAGGDRRGRRSVAPQALRCARVRNDYRPAWHHGWAGCSW